MVVVCVDFDGVLNNYTGWVSEDELFTIREGAKEFMEKLNRKYDVIIFTVRDVDKVKKWMDDYDYDLTFNSEYWNEEDGGELINEDDYWGVNITENNYVSADLISFAMAMELENYLIGLLEE